MTDKQRTAALSRLTGPFPPALVNQPAPTGPRWFGVDLAGHASYDVRVEMTQDPHGRLMVAAYSLAPPRD